MRPHVLQNHWSHLEQRLFEPNPPSYGVFHGRFSRWAGMQRGRTIRDRVVAILNHHGTYDHTIVTNPTQLQHSAKQIKEEMDAAMAARQAAAEASRLTREERAVENVRQEGAFGAVPRGYGVDAPRVPGADPARQRQNQVACDLLAQNPRSQNDHLRPIIPFDGPAPPARVGEGVVTPIQAAEGAGGEQPARIIQRQQRGPPPPLPTLGEFAVMPVPPPIAANNAAAALPAAPGRAGAANNAAREAAVRNQQYIAAAATAGVGPPMVVDEVDAALMRRPRNIDRSDVLDNLNRGFLRTTDSLVTLFRARQNREQTTAEKLENAYKRRKIAVEIGDQESIDHCVRICRDLEAQERKEVLGFDLE